MSDSLVAAREDLDIYEEVKAIHERYRQVQARISELQSFQEKLKRQLM